MSALIKRMQTRSGSRAVGSCYAEDGLLNERCDKRIRHLLIAIDLVFLLLFLSGCYESCSFLFKIGSLVIAFGCFLNVSWNSRILGWIWVYLFIIALFLFAQYVNTSFSYNQSFIQFFFASYYYLFSLLIPVFYYLLNEAGLKRVLANLEFLVMAISGYMLFAALIYMVFGINFTEINRLRNDLLRINAPYIVQLGCVIAAYLLMCEKEQRKLHALTCLLSFSAILLVYQSRLVAILISFIILFIFALRSRDDAGASFIGVMLALIVFLLLCTIGPLGGVLNSFSVSSDYGASTITRIFEIEYYLSLFHKYPLNGVGLVPFGSTPYGLLTGPFNNFYIDDVGIIGALAQIGLWVVSFYVLPMIVMGFRLFTNKCQAPKLLLSAIVFYLLGTSFTTLIVFPYFDPAWSLCLALFAFDQSMKVESKKI